MKFKEIEGEHTPTYRRGSFLPNRVTYYARL